MQIVHEIFQLLHFEQTPCLPSNDHIILASSLLDIAEIIEEFNWLPASRAVKTRFEDFFSCIFRTYN